MCGGGGGRKRGRVAALKKAVPAAGLVVVVAMELAALKLPCAGVDADLRAQAIEWSVTRGARNGRIAWQFVQDLAGRLGVRID